MVRAFVAIVTAAGTSPDVIDEICDLDAVRHADIVAGTYDLIAEIEADSERDLLSVVTQEVRTVAGVEETQTYIVLW